MEKRSAFDSIGESQNILVSGKGGVGKSTIAATLALHYSDNQENTLAIDMDAAHSIADSLGYDVNTVPDGTSFSNYNENLSLYFLGKIIPDFFEGETIQSLLQSGVNFDELNSHLDALVNLDNSFMSLMRLATYDNFVSVAKDHENVAYVIQLLDLFEKSIIHKIRGKSKQSFKLDTPHSRRIIDSENTKGLLRILKSVISVRTTITSMHKAFHGNMLEQGGKIITKQAIKKQDTLHQFALGDIATNPDEYIRESINFIKSIIETKIVIVTAPGYNEINQTITEIQWLISFGVIPSHIIVNKYKDHYDKDSENTQAAYDELVRKIDAPDTGISTVDCDFNMLPHHIPQDEKMQLTRRNLENIAEVI